MGINYEKARTLKQELANELIPREGRGIIHAIGLGIHGDTNEYRVQVFLTPDQLSRSIDTKTSIRLPESDDIEYIYAPHVTALSAGTSPIEPTASFSTLIPGISIGSERLAARYGTLGYFCSRVDETTRSKSNYILSNAHVLADVRAGRPLVRSWIKQPGPGDGIGIKVAELSDLTPIAFSPDRSIVNFVDAGIARINRLIKFDTTFPEIGKLKGKTRNNDIKADLLCHKFGRTTLYTTGRILTINALVEVEYGLNKKAWFDHQIFIEPFGKSQFFCGSGDSGSLIADIDNNAIGLLFAGTDIRTDRAKALSDRLLSTMGKKLFTFGVANPIEMVESALNIELMI